jgi:hypothetical protein
MAMSTDGRHCSKIDEDDHVGTSSNVDLNIIVYSFIQVHACLWTSLVKRTFNEIIWVINVYWIILDQILNFMVETWV